MSMSVFEPGAEAFDRGYYTAVLAARDHIADAGNRNTMRSIRA